MRRRAATVAILGAALVHSAVARASAGADVVDDSEVETPGTCHLELWGSSLPGGGSLFNIGPACTPKRLPWLEIDGFINRFDPARGGAARTIGFGPKVNLRPAASGIGVGASAVVALDMRDGAPAYIVANLPVTVPIGDRWVVNANIGAQRTRGIHGFGVTAGAQATWQPPSGPQFMLETFVVGGGPIGQQGHLRWTVDRGRIDIDLLAARYPDGVSRRALTLGLTIRR